MLQLICNFFQALHINAALKQTKFRLLMTFFRRTVLRNNRNDVHVVVQNLTFYVAVKRSTRSDGFN